MILERFPEIQRMSAEEKLLFVSEVWNDLEQHPADVPVPRAMIAELEKRAAHFRENPGEFTTWDSIRERIQGSKR